MAPASDQYNCIAWSVGETAIWYNPIRSEDGTNIVGIDQVYGNPKNGVFEISDMDAFYDAKGYEPTATGPEDADIMYYSGFHAARKSDSCADMYESKLGGAERIAHVWDQLNGNVY